MEQYISDGAKYVLDKLNRYGYEAFIVGGCVRDILMSKAPHDYDITTIAKPDEVLKVFSNDKVFETGIKHGTVTIVKNHENIEVTTYRIDGEYLDNRHPSNVSFSTDVKNDLSRRDFTINSICMDSGGRIYDYFGGKEDISNKVIKAIGEPKKRFEEDALRILRAVRFSSTLGFKIEPETKKAMIECSHLLKNISKERIASEIDKFLLGKYVKESLLSNYDIIGEIIPEIKLMHGFDQNNIHHIYDLLSHTAIVIEEIEPVRYLRLSALFHDVGKISTCKLGEDNQCHFYSHASVSYEIARNYFNEYKYDNQTKDLALKLIKAHDTPIEENRVIIKRRLNKYGKDLFFDLIRLQRADNKAQNPDFDRTSHFDNVEKIANEIIAKEECFSLKSLAIDGKDLISLGMTEGHDIGETLDHLLKLVLNEKIENTKEALIKEVERMRNKQ